MSSRKLSDTYIALRWKIDEPSAIFFPSETFYRYWNSLKDNIENTKYYKTYFKMRFYPVKWKVNVEFNTKKKLRFYFFLNQKNARLKEYIKSPYVCIWI